MSFTFSARTILELGKELISSDDVAIYELIKNAVDARSPRVEINVSVQLRNSDYLDAITQINEDGKSPSEVKDFIRGKLIDVEKSKSATMLDELEKSSEKEDFLRTLASLYDELNYIEFKDAGHGMSLNDLTSVFLRIGTSSRRKENLQGAKNLGDKGIGRLSAMRLGDRLRVKTARREDRYWNLLDIDWTLFSRDDDVDADMINIEPEIGDEKAEPGEQGTTIRVSALQADWDLPRFTDILQGRIARMIDPFDRGSANRLIVARYNSRRVHVPSIPDPLLQAAHAVCHMTFRMEGHTPIVKGEIDYRYRHRKSKIDERGAAVYSLAQEPVKRRAKRGHAAFKLIPVRPFAFKQLGSFSCDIYWYNRRVVTAVEGLTTKVPETRREISNWSGGPMLYRHGFRILPYGDPKDDWLALDETAFGMSGFKLNRQQMIGRVLLDTPHEALREQTNREGLITSDTFGALQRILMWVVHTAMRGLINEADNIEFIRRREAEQDTKTVADARRRVEADLKRLREHVGTAAAPEMDNLSGSVNRLSIQSQNLIERVKGVISEADEEREKFVYLAGIGLMTEFIFHELERAVTHTIDLISRDSTMQQTTIESLQDQLKTLHKRIAAFDELTSEKRQTKSDFDLVELVRQILENHEREFERHGIAVCFEHPQDPFKIKAVRGMVIQILENLIANAAYWLKQQKLFEWDLKPSLNVVVDLEDKILSIEDNGPGVTSENLERIFQPFITTKPIGQGRGLGLYIARDLAEYHRWRLQMDTEFGRIREGRTNMFVLEMR